MLVAVDGGRCVIKVGVDDTPGRAVQQVALVVVAGPDDQVGLGDVGAVGNEQGSADSSLRSQFVESPIDREDPRRSRVDRRDDLRVAATQPVLRAPRTDGEVDVERPFRAGVDECHTRREAAADGL